MDMMSSNSFLMLEKSMGYLWTKQAAILDNIANAETPNYKAKSVTFEESLKEKLEHILTYFWLPIVIVLVSVFFIVTMIVNFAQQKDTVVSVCLVNDMADADVLLPYMDEFVREQGYDLEEYEAEVVNNIYLTGPDFVANYQAMQVVMSMVAAESLDLVFGDEAAILRYGHQEYLRDLREVLSPEQLEKYADRLLYLDMAFLREVSEAPVSGEEPDFPDPRKPEDMAEPIPFAIDLGTDTDMSRMAYPLSGGMVGVVVNAPNLENALTFLDYILD